MHSLSFTLRYRPIRIGWCIRAGDIQALRQSVRTSLTMCGGARNPLLVIDDQDGATALVKAANIDLLLAVREDDGITAFAKRFEEVLPPWALHEQIFEEYPPMLMRPAFLDIVLAAGELVATEAVKRTKPPTVRLFEWTDDDPLADLLLVNFGGLPRQNESGAFIREHLQEVINVATTTVKPGEVIGLPEEGDVNLRRLTERGLEYALRERRAYPRTGFFIGQSESFWDLVNFWNLRAAGDRLLMYNSGCAARLQMWRNDLIRHLKEIGLPLTAGDSRAVFARPNADDLKGGWLPDEVIFYPNQTPERHYPVSIPRLYYAEHHALANLDTTHGRQTAVMPLPPRPLPSRHRLDTRNVALTVQPAWGLADDSRATFLTPNLPVMNTYYGQKLWYEWNATRVESSGIALLQHYAADSLTIDALDVVALLREIFKRIGIPTEISQAGLVTARVIAQMGKLDDCRPFRVRGLRTLIEETRPDGTFTRSGAIQAIREVGSDESVGFDRYDDLHIEPRPARLTPDSVFNYMVSRGAFRVGLKFTCPECSLEFWISLDNATATPECEFCGKQFDATPQLRDRDWRYRRSGVFGKADSQQGAIPVALTLLRFLHMEPGPSMLYAPALRLLSGGAISNTCEADFLALFQHVDFRGAAVQVAVGECKTRMEITEQDVRNLSAVADVLDSNGIEAYVVFSKLSEFSDAELVRIQRANSKGRQRAIVLTEKELQHWFPYKWAEGKHRSSSLSDFATSSAELYLRPAAQRVSAGGSGITK